MFGKKKDDDHPVIPWPESPVTSIRTVMSLWGLHTAEVLGHEAMCHVMWTCGGPEAYEMEHGFLHHPANARHLGTEGMIAMAHCCEIIELLLYTYPDPATGHTHPPLMQIIEPTIPSVAEKIKRHHELETEKDEPDVEVIYLDEFEDEEDHGDDM